MQVIPLIGLALKGKQHQRLRLGLQAGVGGAVLIYAHAHALGGSSDVTGG